MQDHVGHSKVTCYNVIVNYVHSFIYISWLLHRMLEESGLLQEEPVKVLPSVESPQTANTQRSKSLPSHRKTPVKKTHFIKGSKSLTTSSSESSGLTLKQSSQDIEVHTCIS